MASLLDDTLFETRGQAPAPSKDFYQIIVTRKEVIFRWWKISLRSEFREARPGELKESHEDFLDDPSLQTLVENSTEESLLLHGGFLQLAENYGINHPSSFQDEAEEVCCNIEYLKRVQQLKWAFNNVQIAIVFGASTLEHIFNLCRGDFDFLVRLPDTLLLYIMSYLDLEDIARLSQVSHRLETLCNSDKLWEMVVQDLLGTITPEMKSLAQEIGWKQFFFTNKLQLQLQLRRRRNKSAGSSGSQSD